RPRDMAGRWDNFSTHARIDPTSQTLQMTPVSAMGQNPVVRRGVRAERFELTFRFTRPGPFATNRLKLLFNVQDKGHYDYLRLPHNDITEAPTARSKIDGGTVTTVSGTSYAGNMPATSDSTILWYRVVSDGTDVKVYCQESATE